LGTSWEALVCGAEKVTGQHTVKWLKLNRFPIYATLGLKFRAGRSGGRMSVEGDRIR